MLMTWIEEARQMLREMPWTAAALLVAIVFGMGAHASIFYEADGEHVRLVADRDSHAKSTPAKLLTMVEQKTMCNEKIPGFTVVVGLSEYSVELSVPVEGMRSMLDEAQMKLADSFSVCKRSMA
jgi:hypothetical protein